MFVWHRIPIGGRGTEKNVCLSGSGQYMVAAEGLHELVPLSQRRRFWPKVEMPHGSARSFVPQDDLYQESSSIAIIPDICYRESVLGLFAWIPADDLRG
jgi:hypothetical protein